LVNSHTVSAVWAVFTEQELNPVYVEISELILLPWLWPIFRSLDSHWEKLFRHLVLLAPTDQGGGCAIAWERVCKCMVLFVDLFSRSS